MDRYEARQAVDKAFEAAQPKGIETKKLREVANSLSDKVAEWSKAPDRYTEQDWQLLADTTVRDLRDAHMPEAEAREFVDSLIKEQREAHTPAAPEVKTPAAFAPFKPQKTVKAVKQALLDGGYVDSVEFGKLHVETANEMAASLSAHLERFPELRSQQSRIGSIQSRQRDLRESIIDRKLRDNAKLYQNFYSDRSPEELRKLAGKGVKRMSVAKNVWAYSAVSNPGSQRDAYGAFDGVFTNEEHGAKPEAWKESLKRNVETKFHPEGCDTIKSLFDHEYAHQIDKLIGLRDHPEMRQIWNDATKDRNRVREELSGYAVFDGNTRFQPDPAEYIAEAWAEYLNNPNPRPRAKQVGELIERVYKEKFS